MFASKKDYKDIHGISCRDICTMLAQMIIEVKNTCYVQKKIKSKNFFF